MIALSKLSIRATLGALIGVMGVMLIASTVSDVSDAYSRYAAAQRIASYAPISQALFKTLQEARLERGNTQTALSGEAPVVASMADDIAKNRKVTEEGYAASVALLAKVSLPGLDQAIGKLKASHEALAALRGKAANDIRVPRAQRDAALIRDWAGVGQNFLDQLEATGTLLENSLLFFDPVIDQTLSVKRAAWTVRSAAGSTVLRIGSTLSAGRAWTAEEAQAQARDLGIASAAWTIVREASARPELAKSIDAAVKAAQPNFTGPLAEENAALGKQLAAGEKPAMAAPDFLRTRIEALALIGNVSVVALAEIVRMADDQIAAAQSALVLNALLLLLAIGLIVAGFLIAMRRISAPIRALTGAMQRLAAHDLATDIPGASRGDEIGAMARAVQVFKTSGIERELLEAEALASHRREKLRENEKRELAESAAQAAHERVLALEEKMRMEAEFARVERLANLGGLVAGVAHELNTPIGNAVTVASTLSERAEGFARELAAGQVRKSSLERLIDELRDGTAILMRGLQRASDLIQHFKRVAVDQTSEQRRVFRIDELVSDIAGTMAPQLSRAGVALNADIDVKPPLDSYPGPLGQVLLNLVGNAQIHGIGEGNSGTITIAARQSGADAIEISVRDGGKGIPAGLRDRIFEPFFTTRLGQGGSGLGLSIVHNIVTKVLGGTIRVDSEVGHGTTMTMRIPLRAPTGAQGQLEGTYDVGHAKRAG
ncbi:MAG: HAMP domain-containing histidine kinase [Alphaproteobacteria bacterium]|nr:HAMP domain-containing histidine kinase [Alphaproteobacteria bacterium]